ncbi:MAG TPA: hypothetical protein VKW78_18620 [Terriglobales bacterium]|nr:hypothetical protein [Terriglobales bacterium]
MAIFFQKLRRCTVRRNDLPVDLGTPSPLRKSGIPEALIEAAAQSNPQGLILFEDLPQFKGCDNQPSAHEPTR